MAIQPADERERLLFFSHLLALSGGFISGNK